MGGVLLDTVALYRLLNGDVMARTALAVISAAQSRQVLFVSVVTPLEVALASNKKSPTRRMNLNGQSPREFCERGLGHIGARLIGVGRRVAIAAVEAPMLLGHGDPADCLIVATAHVRKLTLVTSDRLMIQLSANRPRYLNVVRC